MLQARREEGEDGGMIERGGSLTLDLKACCDAQQVDGRKATSELIFPHQSPFFKPSPRRRGLHPSLHVRHVNGE